MPAPNKSNPICLQCFGNRQFPITQDGETLICGNVTGRLVSTPKVEVGEQEFNQMLLDFAHLIYEDKEGDFE